jgi:hypothetical protein
MDGASYRSARQAASPDHESASKMTEAPAPKGEQGWKVESVNIRQAKNGGFIVTCSKTRESAGGSGNGAGAPGRDYESNDYAFRSMPEVMDYVAQEFGVSQTPAAAAAPEPMLDDDTESEYA